MSIYVLCIRTFILLSVGSLATSNESKKQDKCPCDVSTSAMIAKCEGKHITSVPDCIPNNTRHLFLDNNDLIYSPGQFQRFRDLQELVLYSNANYTAQYDSFRGLYQLQILNLGWTECTHLTDGTFEDLHNLTALVLSDFSGNLNLNPILFVPLKNLRKLDLSENPTLKIQNYLFNELSKLEILAIDNLVYLELNDHAFEGLTALKTLSLTDSQFTEGFSEDIFKPLIQLEEIHLQGLCNTILPSFNCTTIVKGLKHAPTLKRIYIDNILINKLGKEFQTLKTLEELHLIQGERPEFCKVFRLEADLFKNLEALPLTKLVLDNCFIELIADAPFSSLSNLSTLSLNIETEFDILFLDHFAKDLNYANLESLSLFITSSYPCYVLPKIPGLSETKVKSFELSLTSLLEVRELLQLPQSLVNLTLRNNRIHYFAAADLNYFKKLEILDLSDQMEDTPRSLTKSTERNQLSVTTIGTPKLRDRQNKTFGDWLTLPYKLKSLNVRNSSLLCIMTPFFIGSNNSLRTLDASEQRDRSCIKSNEFWTNIKNLVKLEELKLDWNLISEIPHTAFSQQSMLRTLSLKGNKLIQLSFYIGAMKYLQTLDVSSNSIGYASTSFTKDTKDIAASPKFTLDLSDNPLVCDCQHQDFVAWLRDTNVIFEKNDLNCTFENGTKISLSQIAKIHDSLEVECIMLEIIVVCAMTFFIFNLLFGSIAYTWHIRQKLGYLLSYGRHTLNPYHPIEECNIDIECDVYILYEGESYVTPNETLRQFVLYKLIPGLERRGFKVGIREMLDSGSLYEIISKAVRRSKKVLVLLTKDFCKDMWNVFEFNQAVMEGIYTNRQIAIPILFESLGRDTVKEEVFAFLRMEPVARYSPDVSDRAFIDYVCERIRNTTREFN